MRVVLINRDTSRIPKIFEVTDGVHIFLGLCFNYVERVPSGQRTYHFCSLSISYKGLYTNGWLVVV